MRNSVRWHLNRGLLITDIKERIWEFLLLGHKTFSYNDVSFWLRNWCRMINYALITRYLSYAIQTVATATTRCGLWSSATTDFVMPWTHSKFRERAFAYAGPTAQNRLPEHIRRQSTPATFRRHLKTFLSASLSKRGAYWDRLCRDVVGCWSSRACTVAKRCILGL